MRLFFIGMLLVLAVACHDDSPGPVNGEALRTVVVYLGVDNNFSGEDREKIESLVSGWKSSFNGYLLVYADPRGKAPYLTRIYWKDGKAVQEEVRRYEESNSADPAVFRRVLTEITEEYPAQSYGLVVLSHGSGWLPAQALARPQSIITDGSSEMELKDFAGALPVKMDFVIFDACFMGSVEVAYELRDKADYVVFSPAEVLVPGFVYKSMMTHLMKKKPDLKAVAREYYEYYDKQSGYYRSATVSVVKTEALEELAVLSRQLLKDRDGEQEVNLQKIQRFGYGRDLLYFDFGDYIRSLEPARFEEFSKTLDKCVIYKAATPSYYSVAVGGFTPINAFSGVAIYIPQSFYPSLNTAYRQLKWTKRVNL